MDLFKKLPKWVRMPSKQISWWIKITTEFPKCTYFFGPFGTFSEANFFQPGYIEDLKGENAQGIQVKIEQCEPKELTIMEIEDDF